MKKTSLLFAVALAMIAAAVPVLLQFKFHHRLGKAGVRIGPTPLFDQKGAQLATQSVSLPETLPHFKSEAIPFEDAVIGALPKDTTYGQRRYTSEDNLQIDISTVVMGSDRTSIHKPEFCLTAGGWYRL